MEENLLDKMNREHFNNELIIQKAYTKGPLACNWKIGLAHDDKCFWGFEIPFYEIPSLQTIEQLTPRLNDWLSKKQEELRSEFMKKMELKLLEIGMTKSFCLDEDSENKSNCKGYISLREM